MTEPRSHVTFAEIAAALGIDKSNVTRRTKKEAWPAEKRPGRGGGVWFALARLPKYVRDAVRLHLLDQAVMGALNDSSSPAVATPPVISAAGASVPAAFSTPHPLTDRQRLERDARQGVLTAITRLQAQAQCSREAAMQTLLTMARAGKMGEHEDRMLRLARDPRGRAGDGYPSIRTLKRWLGAEDLTPRIAEKDFSVPRWFVDFLAHYQQAQKHSVPAAYRMAFGCEPLGKAQGGIPSIHQVNRLLKKMGAVSKQTGRMLPRELKAIQPFIRRTTDHLWPDDVYTSDGHTFDAEVAHPKHGRPFRPEITTVLSVATRKCVGWSMGLAESAWGVLDAQRHAIETHGIPALWYFDRGPGFDNLMQTDEVVGFAARWGSEITNSLPYNSQARGLEERSHRTFLVAAAKKLPTYMGAAMDREARQKVFKITRADIKATGTSRHLMAWDVFLAFIGSEVAAYNARPHGSLPKFTDAEGTRRHMSPNEAWEAARAEGWEPTLITEAEREDMFLPYTLAKVIRGEIRLFNNLYFSQTLAEYHGEKVRVGYDIHDASRVWVRSQGDGRLICIAEFQANHRAYFAQSVVSRSAEKRAKTREARLQAHLDEVRDELHGVAALEHQSADAITAEAWAAQLDQTRAARMAETASQSQPAALEGEVIHVAFDGAPSRAGRPLFATDPDMYRWLKGHPEAWTEGDADWLLEYVAGADYEDLASRYAHQGVAWCEADGDRARSLIHNEWASLQHHL